VEIIGKSYKLAIFWWLKIMGRETSIFGLKSGKNHFGLIELQISCVNIAQFGCSRGIRKC